METLQTAHRRISEWFSARQNAHSEPAPQVFFIVHGLSSDDLTALFHDVRQSLRTSSLESFLWTTSYLPLLVCAVEAGYGYEGNGTDFWPLLEKRLEHPFGIEERIRLSGWFEKASKQFGGVRPGESDWEQVFCHIAGPISSPTPSSGDVWVLSRNSCTWPEDTRERIGETRDAELYAVAASDPILRDWLAGPRSGTINRNQNASPDVFFRPRYPLVKTGDETLLPTTRSAFRLSVIKL